MFRIAKTIGEKWGVSIFSPQIASRRFGPARSTIVLYSSIVVLSTVLFLFFAKVPWNPSLMHGYYLPLFFAENCIPRFLGAFPDPLSRKFSTCERARPLSILNSNGESALDLREQPWWIRKVAHYFFFSSFGFNLKSGRGTRANLHKNGHKRIRKMFLNSGFESGTDLNKTRKWPLHFFPQLVLTACE